MTRKNDRELSKRPECVSSVSDDRMMLHELDDSVDVTREWRAADVVCSEEFLCLGGIVDLFHKKIRDGVVR